MKIYITSAAKAMRDIESDLVNHVDQIEENFIKLLIAPQATTRNHWQGEIASQIHKIRKSKGAKTFPDASKIFRWLYTDQLVELQDLKYFRNTVLFICDVENFDIPNDLVSLNHKLCAVLKDYYTWLASKLSTEGSIPRSEILQKLDELV